MRTDTLIRVLAPALLLIATSFVQATADPVTAPGSSDSDKPAQPPSETPTTQPGEKSAEGGDNTNTPAEIFVPSESISADSAVSFPVDI
jgi:hypothetical protein